MIQRTAGGYFILLPRGGTMIPAAKTRDNVQNPYSHSIVPGGFEVTS